MAHLKYLALCFVFGSCAQFYTTKTTPDKTGVTVVVQDAGSKLAGSFIDENGDEVFLADLQDKPIVLMFAGITCGNCIAEAKEIIASFKKGPAQSDVVNFVTVLDNKRISRWRRNFQEKQPDWLHGYTTNDDLYYTYFPKQAEDTEFPLTPAMVLYHPFKNKLFLHKGTEPLGDDISLVDYIRAHVGHWES